MGIGLASPSPRRRLAGSVHAWERWEPAWHWAFYALLALATGLAVAGSSAMGSNPVVVAVLAATLSGWYWGWALRRRIWDRTGLQVLAYLAGAATLWVLLILTSEAYFMLAPIAYAQASAFLPTTRSAVAGAVAVTGILTVLTVVEGTEPSWTAMVPAVLSIGAAIAVTLFVDAIIRESQERHRLITELEATRRQLAAAERQAGRLEERQRLAREIHDTLAQGFTSIVMLLEAAESDLGAARPSARTQLDHARRTARESLAEARGVLWALQPAPLEGASLPEALGRLAEHLQEETGLAATATVTGTPHSLPTRAETALLRTAQEGVANIRKHARAREAVLTLSYLGDSVALDIRDDGQGFDPGSAALRPQGGSGLGLQGMRARLADVGGTLTVESAPGEGTTVVAVVPAESGRET